VERTLTTLRGTGVVNLQVYMPWMEAWESGRLHSCCLLRMTVAIAASFTTSYYSVSSKTQQKQISSLTLLILWTYPVVKLLPQRHARYPLESIKCRTLCI
jgi:hypothetical protein